MNLILILQHCEMYKVIMLYFAQLAILQEQDYSSNLLDIDLQKIFPPAPPLQPHGELSVNFFFSANQKYLPDVALTQTFN